MEVGKSEAPRAALPAEASAPPGATPRLDDPPLIDLRALAFASTNVNRPSEPKPRRAIPFCRFRLPGCPAKLPRRSRHAAPATGCPAADADAPTLWIAPTVPAVASWPRLALRLASLAPCGPFAAVRNRSSVPGLRCADRYEDTLQQPFPLVKRYFSSSQGSPQECAVSHRISLFVHCSHTGCSQVAR